MNRLAEVHSKSLSSLKHKPKVKTSKPINSEYIKDKKKDMGKTCLKKWAEKGCKSQPKRLY